MAMLTRKKSKDLSTYEKSVYSQNGEDGVIKEILKRVGADSKFAVEFGVEDGTECNTRLLKEQGWKVLMMDGNDNNPPSIKQEYITAENINKLFAKYKVPTNLDILSIDIDSNDFWVWRALDNKYQPRLVIIEYNASVAPNLAKTVAYDPKLQWDKTDYYGGSLLAMYRLAKRKGYSLVHCEQRGVNAFFVRDDLVSSKLPAKLPIDAYQGPRYGEQADGCWLGHPQSKRRLIDLTDEMYTLS